jgi:hypothetical protein
MAASRLSNGSTSSVKNGRIFGPLSKWIAHWQLGPCCSVRAEILGARFQSVEQVWGNVVGVDVDGHCGCWLTIAAIQEAKARASTKA